MCCVYLPVRARENSYVILPPVFQPHIVFISTVHINQSERLLMYMPFER